MSNARQKTKVGFNWETMVQLAKVFHGKSTTLSNFLNLLVFGERHLSLEVLPPL